MVTLSLVASCFSDPDQVSGEGTTQTSNDGTSSSDPTITTVPTTTAASEDSGPSEASESSPSGTDGTLDPSSSSAGETTDDATTGDVLPACPPNPGTILYLNFDGQEVTWSGGGPDNAPQGIANESLIEGTYGSYDEADRGALLQRVRDHYAGFDLCVTDVRPDEPSYDMLVITSESLDGNPNLIGFPSDDCGNATDNNLNVLFLPPIVGLDVARKSIAISKLTAAFYGVETVETEQAEVMYRFVADTLPDAAFLSECNAIVDGPQCPSTPECQVGWQNSAARLANALGSAP